MRIVTAAEMQAMDQRTITGFGIPGRVLMENAGRGATRSFLQRIYAAGPGRVGVMAGRGNNGGDGFVMARYLRERGIAVEVFLLTTADRVESDAKANLMLLPALKVPVTEMPDLASLAARKAHLRHVRYWIDAIFGTGLNAEVRGYYKEVIEFINGAGRPVLAVDIPSGLHADTGQPCGTCIRAAATATFGFAKIGHLVEPGAEYCGAVDVIDIGIPACVAEEVEARQYAVTGALVQGMLPQRLSDSHKGDTGHVLILAGSTGKTGAAAMASEAALRIGAGLVTLGVPASLNPVLENKLTEVMSLPLPDQGRGYLDAQAWEAVAGALAGKRCAAVGPGLGTQPATRELVLRLVRECDLPLVIDADGLNNLVGNLSLLAGRSAPTVLTPHPGEAARLIETGAAEVQKDRPQAARTLARRSKACVILKGARTVIADPQGRIWINPTGNAGMASGGMGDVLTGAVAGWLAQGRPPLEASIGAVYIHGLAADLLAAETPFGYLAGDVLRLLPRAMQQVRLAPPEGPVNGPLL